MRAPAIDLTGATVAVTGGARGIGLATARAFVAAGARVAIGDLDGDVAERAAGELGAGTTAHALDVRSRESFAAFVAAAEQPSGAIDVLVNNAGVMPIAPFLDESDGSSAATLDVNVWGPLLGMRIAAPAMVRRGRGHIVNVASGLGKTAVPGLAVYCASKHAVIGLSSAVRQELAGSGVTVTAVVPSAVRTELSSGIPRGFGLPLVDPEDVAREIVRSCRRRPAEIAVPRWTGAALALGQAVPDRLLRMLDRTLAADRALTSLDRAARQAYEDRIGRQAVQGSNRREDRP